MPRIDGDDSLPGLDVVALLIDAVALPSNLDPDFLGSKIDELAHRVLFAGGDHIILRCLLLQYQPLHLDIVARMAPIALRSEVAEMHALLKSKLDARQRALDLAANKRLASEW